VDDSSSSTLVPSLAGAGWALPVVPVESDWFRIDGLDVSSEVKSGGFAAYIVAVPPRSERMLTLTRTLRARFSRRRRCFERSFLSWVTIGSAHKEMLAHDRHANEQHHSQQAGKQERIALTHMKVPCQAHRADADPIRSTTTLAGED